LRIADVSPLRSDSSGVRAGSVSGSRLSQVEGGFTMQEQQVQQEKRSRFQIEQLEERIAPSATGNPGNNNPGQNNTNNPGNQPPNGNSNH